MRRRLSESEAPSSQTRRSFRPRNQASTTSHGPIPLLPPTARRGGGASSPSAPATAAATSPSGASCLAV
uniref:Uncharacterized protein n=1 Tax=Oryza glumipatula TaxID=40148 RepID=A0A0E0B9Y2_9ORYZ